MTREARLCIGRQLVKVIEIKEEMEPDSETNYFFDIKEEMVSNSETNYFFDIKEEVESDNETNNVLVGDSHSSSHYINDAKQHVDKGPVFSLKCLHDDSKVPDLNIVQNNSSNVPQISPTHSSPLIPARKTPRKGLRKDKVVALFQDLPSDEKSDVSDPATTDEEYFPDVLEEDLSEDDDILDEEVQNLSKHSQISGVTWTKNQTASANIPEFSEKTGPSEEILEMECMDPVFLFLSLVSLELMENIVFHTNLYAVQLNKQFTPLDLSEVLKFLAVNLLMGIKRLPSYRDYWSSAPELNDPYISSCMSVKRFSWILTNLHLNDNSVQPKQGEQNYDPLYKVRPLLTHLSARFLSVFYPKQNQAIGVSLIKFKGRSSLKHYMPLKHIKHGYKVWIHCDESGFVCQFEVQTRKNGELIERNLSEKIVQNLCSSIFGKNHKLFMDRFFTSYNLFRLLKTQNIFCCGTVNLSQKHLPQNLSEDKAMKLGDFDYAVSSDEIVCIKWMDKRSICVLSSQGNASVTKHVQKKDKDSSKVDIPCPRAITDYNKNMGFVVHFNHMKSLYETDRKSTKWWHRIFFHFIDVAVINSFILHKETHNESIRMNLKDFRREIITGLIAMANVINPPKRPFLKQTNHIAIKRHKPFIPAEKRLKNADHLAVRTTVRRCALCSTKQKPKRTKWMCSTCKVPLCMQATANKTCFQKFHSK